MRIFRWGLFAFNLIAVMVLLFFINGKNTLLFAALITMSGMFLLCFFFNKLKSKMFGKATALLNLLAGLLSFLLLGAMIFPSLLGDNCPFADVRSDKNLFILLFVCLLSWGILFISNAVFLYIPDKKDTLSQQEEAESSRE